jgi:uncharacterized RDD family membrane protein YckC
MKVGDLAWGESTIGAEPRQTVTSPEQVELELPIAGPTSRILAYGIDQVILIVLELALIGVVILTSEAASSWLEGMLSEVGEQVRSRGTVDDGHAVLFLVAAFLVFQLVVELAYFVGAELATGGRSIGKAFVGLRVVCDGGAPVTPAASLVRNLLRAVDVLPANYLVGFVAIALSPAAKRLGDVAAGTVVVRLDRPVTAEPLALDPSDAAGFRFERAQIARLGPGERTLLRQTLRRLDSLEPERADALLTRVTAALATAIGHPPVEALERRAFLRALLATTTRFPRMGTRA